MLSSCSYSISSAPSIPLDNTGFVSVGLDNSTTLVCVCFPRTNVKDNLLPFLTVPTNALSWLLVEILVSLNDVMMSSGWISAFAAGSLVLHQKLKYHSWG